MLVQIPWQPQFWLRPEALALLVAASQKRGHNLFLFGDPAAAWRSYEQQKALYQRHLATPGSPVVSSPDSGPRPHMRGGAFDLRDTDAATQAACRAVGLVREPSETWHWQHPATLSWPIIPTNTSAAGGTPTPIPPTTLKESPMFSLTNDTTGKVYIRGPIGRLWITGYAPAKISATAMLSLLERAQQEMLTGSRGTFLEAELQAVDAYVKSVSVAASTTIDYDTLAKQLAHELEDDFAALDTQADTYQAQNVAMIRDVNANIDDQPTTFEVVPKA